MGGLLLLDLGEDDRLAQGLFEHRQLPPGGPRLKLGIAAHRQVQPDVSAPVAQGELLHHPVAGSVERLGEAQEGREDADTAAGFLRITSTVYPQLETYYRKRLRAWVEGEVAARAAEDEGESAE